MASLSSFKNRSSRLSKKSEEFYSGFRSLQDFQIKKYTWALKKELLSDDDKLENYLSYNPLPRHSSTYGFKVSSYRSGEVTGSQYLTGAQSKVMPPSRYGEVETETFTRPARVKIRRAAKCSENLLKFFCTLTFSPTLLHPWHFNEDGTVRHDFAKYKLKKFLNTCAVKQKRLKRTLSYMWAAELQENGNILYPPFR